MYGLTDGRADMQTCPMRDKMDRKEETGSKTKERRTEKEPVLGCYGYTSIYLLRKIARKIPLYYQEMDMLIFKKKYK